jgi:RNA polymerase sigma-70 factor, ECF subfamily
MRRPGVLANQRRSTRRRAALQERLSREASPALEATTPELDTVHDALARLGARDREVLLLAEWEGLSPVQIAAVLGCLTVTARGRLHRARRRFRAELSGPAPRTATQVSRRRIHEHA